MDKTAILMEKAKKIRLYGAGGHSQIIQLLLRQNGAIVDDIFDDDPCSAHKAFNDILPGLRKNPDKFPFKGDPFIVAVGDNYQRREIVRLLNHSFAKAIHTSATLAPQINIGEGTVVYAAAVIQPNTNIGKHVIINTSASVDHDNIIGDYVHISPNASLCGLVEVGEGTHVGAGAVVIPMVKIGEWCTIGAGAVVIRDVPNYAVVVGNPGKIIKWNSICT